MQYLCTHPKGVYPNTCFLIGLGQLLLSGPGTRVCIGFLCRKLLLALLWRTSAHLHGNIYPERGRVFGQRIDGPDKRMGAAA